MRNLDVLPMMMSNQMNPQPHAVSVRTNVRRLKAGETLVTAGDALMGVITIVSGALKLKRPYKAGLFLSGLAGPNETLGFPEAMSAANGARVHRDTMIAIGETEVQIIALDAFEAWLRTQPAMFIEALSGLERPEIEHPERLQTSESLLKRPLDLLPVRARVAATVWSLAQKYGRMDGGVRVIDLDLTREELAHLSGTVYESVIRTLTKLRQEGVIDLEGRMIRVVQDDQLARIGQIVLGA